MDRVALITGGSQGIGFGIAQRLAERGIEQLVLVARDTRKLAEAQLKLSQEHPNTRIAILPADLTKDESYDTIVDFLQQYNKLDILVNNAGDFQQLPKKNADDSLRIKPSEIASDVRKLYDINAVAPTIFALTLKGLLLKSPNPKVLDVLSSAAVQVFDGNIPYRQTKLAHEGTSIALMLDTNGRIKTYRIYPSNTDTRIVSHFDVPKLTPYQVGAAGVDMLLDDTATDTYIKMGAAGPMIESIQLQFTPDGLAFPAAHQSEKHKAFSNIAR